MRDTSRCWRNKITCRRMSSDGAARFDSSMHCSRPSPSRGSGRSTHTGRSSGGTFLASLSPVGVKTGATCRRQCRCHSKASRLFAAYGTLEMRSTVRPRRIGTVAVGRGKPASDSKLGSRRTRPLPRLRFKRGAPILMGMGRPQASRMRQRPRPRPSRMIAHRRSCTARLLHSWWRLSMRQRRVELVRPPSPRWPRARRWMPRDHSRWTTATRGIQRVTRSRWSGLRHSWTKTSPTGRPAALSRTLPASSRTISLHRTGPMRTVKRPWLSTIRRRPPRTSAAAGCCRGSMPKSRRQATPHCLQRTLVRPKM
mmetsp:Transcript_77967/g.223866  ORF Transcript_77967/g.223866 Transcript_77967/m.223866 type:complete len:311 (+) Transcript_77967:660-1592(+)